MKTNRDEILESAFQLFMAMNYERVSLQMITKKVKYMTKIYILLIVM